MSGLPFRILVLEDDVMMLETLVDTLLDEGYEVEPAQNGREAIAKAREKPFDLILADVRMEGIDGLTTIKEVKGFTPDIKSLVVTGFCNEVDQERARKLQVEGFFKKPLHLQDLLDSVRYQVLHRKAGSRRNVERDALLKALDMTLASQMTLAEMRFPQRFERAGGLAKARAWMAYLCAAEQFDAEDVLWGERLFCIQALQAVDPEFDLGVLEQTLPTPVAQAREELAKGVPDSVLGRLTDSLLRYLDGEPAASPHLEYLAAHGAPVADRPRESGEDLARRRSLLALAETLEAQGDLDGARSALEEVYGGDSSGPEAVQARFRSARLAARCNDADTVLGQSEAAVSGARALGPNGFANALLEAAFLVMPFRPAWAVEKLEQAGEVYRRLGTGVAMAKVDLALWAARAEGEAPPREALNEMSRPEHGDEMALCARWLVPALLERGFCQEAALTNIARLFPGEIWALLRSGRLGVEARVRLVRRLKEAGGVGPERLLELLVDDPAPQVREALQSAETRRDGSGLPLVRLYTLGSFAFFRGEEKTSEKAWRRLKNRLLLARLAAARSEVPVDTLIEEFWPGDAEKGRQNVYSAISVARKVLTPSGKGPKLELVVRTGLGLRISPELPFWHDLSEVRSGFTAARRSQEKGLNLEAYEALKRVYQLYQGPYLEGCYMEWALEIRRELENEAVVVFAHLCEWLDAEAMYDELGEFARWMLQFDPCSQTANLHLMRALLGTDRPGDAIRHFERTRKLMASEFGLEPSIDLLREHQRALLAVT
jgi:two-component SAPR family response regulator